MSSEQEKACFESMLLMIKNNREGAEQQVNRWRGAEITAGGATWMREYGGVRLWKAMNVKSKVFNLNMMWIHIYYVKNLLSVIETMKTIKRLHQCACSWKHTQTQKTTHWQLSEQYEGIWMPPHCSSESPRGEGHWSLSRVCVLLPWQTCRLTFGPLREPTQADRDT